MSALSRRDTEARVGPGALLDHRAAGGWLRKRRAPLRYLQDFVAPTAASLTPAQHDTLRLIYGHIANPVPAFRDRHPRHTPIAQLSRIQFAKSAEILGDPKAERNSHSDVLLIKTARYVPASSGTKLAKSISGFAGRARPRDGSGDLPATGSSQWISAAFHDGACCRAARR